MPEIIRAESLWKSAADEDNRSRAWKGKGRTSIQKEFTNIYGDLHGGVLYSAVDTICGIAAGTYGYYVTTVDGQIRYLKAARATEYVTCTAKVVKPGRNITVVSFEIMDSNGMLLNTGDFSFYNLKEKEIL